MSNVRDHQSTQPVIRFKGFTDAWEKRKLGESLTFLKDGTHGTHPDGDYAFLLSAKNISDGKINIDESDRRINEHDYRTIFKNYQLQNNDILMTIVGTIGRTAKYVFTKEPVAFQRSVAILRTDKQTDSNFLETAIHTNVIQRDLERATSMSAQGGVYLGDVAKLNFTKPVSLNEQIKIGAFFANLDTLIAVNQRKGDVLQNFKKALLQRLFASETSPIPDIRFKGFTDAWEKRKLKELGDTYSGLSGKTKEDFGHGEARYVTYMNVFTNPVADPVGTEAIEIDTKQNEVMKNDVFFTTSSETPEEVGMSSVWPIETRNVYLNSFCFGYRVLNQSSLNFLFIAQQLRSPSFRKRMIILAQGISRYNISKKKVLEIPIFRPSLNEQNKIGYFLSNVDDLIAATQRKGEVLKNLKKALLQKMFV
ncbi:restriction endonuclease subunit S [Lacticaseibacillus paracasei]|uniref:restriction endonuclease subunit S n=1 Tax=Lacticaseibacillus paracasei TaxID=1597 RepID=UPI003DA47B76